MNEFNEIMSVNLPILFICLFIFCLMLTIVVISLLVSTYRLKNKYNYFLGDTKDKKTTIEGLLETYIDESRRIENNFTNIEDEIGKIKNSLKLCVQKVGIVRYNPFEDVGGNLSFAIALLDAKNNGVVFNGIYSRSGSFTYAKPVENGNSQIILSDEEKKAIEIATNKVN